MLPQKKFFPKISACIVTYNHEKIITECIDGVLMQDYLGEIEIILADDCSTDNTDLVIKNHIESTNIPENITIKYTRHQTNKGYVGNLRWVLQQATGDYIALCDGDDFWNNKEKLKMQCDFLEKNSDYSLCYTSYQCIDEKGDFGAVAKNGLNKQNNADEVLQGRFLLPVRTAFSRNFSKEFLEFLDKIPNKTSCDRIYPYFYALKGKVKFIDEITAVYRVHEGGIWSSLDERKKIKASIEQQLIFIQHATDDEVKKIRSKEIFFRDVLSKLYFKFVKEPTKTINNVIFVLKDYKMARMQVLPAVLDFSAYYFNLLKNKI